MVEANFTFANCLRLRVVIYLCSKVCFVDVHDGLSCFCSQELRGEFTEAVWLPRDSESSLFSPDLLCKECLPPSFIAATTYCTIAIEPSTMVHTASPIATLNE